MRVEGDEHQNFVTWITWGVVQVLWSPWSPWGWLALWNLGSALDFQAPPIRQKVPVLGGGRDEVSTAVGWALGGWGQ